MHYKHISETIFYPKRTLPEDLRDTRIREEVTKQIHNDTETYSLFSRLGSEAKEALIEFCMGNRNLKITYEPFFQYIFNPEIHPERLSNLLSAILKQKVKIIHVLPREGMRLSEDSSLVIMDILVELEDGSLVNVEIQRYGYYFPMQRSFCYGADLLVRQYAKLKETMGQKFTYQNMRPVYVIILMENSPEAFAKFPNSFIHRSSFQFDTGLDLGNLLNFIYIPLDIFRGLPHNEIGELESWLYFLGSDEPRDIYRITEQYPFFKELYEDIIKFRYHPKELIRMYSEALAILDRNTVDFMIDDMKKEIKNMREDLTEKEAELAEKYKEIREKEAELAELDAEISEKNAEISEKNAEISQKDAEIARLKALLEQKQ